MSENPKSTVYIGNLDERVTDRILYDILIQAGRVVDLYIPRDRETDKPKGFAFAEYETEEIANYAVRLFTGLVTLYNRTLKFAISGQDKAAANMTSTSMHPSNSPLRSRKPEPFSSMEDPYHSRSLHSSRFSTNPGRYEPDLLPPGVDQDSSPFRSRHDGYNQDYSRRAFGASLDSISRSRPGRF
ncbi:spliceosome-associated protein 49-like [Chenopodium quinoa]|nr:spliceosome-associated protein 49-like [Chenopodium quinoa]